VESTERTETVSYSDPQGWYLQQFTGLSPRRIVLKAKRMGLRMRRIYGRYWIATDDINKLQEDG
jgi:hypothetical protein